MKIQKYILPVFVSSHLMGQTSTELFPDISFGFTHSTFSSQCLQSPQQIPINGEQRHYPAKKTLVSEIQYGFGMGIFMWMPLNENIIFKPKVEGVFSNTCRRQSPCVYATSFDLSISHGFVVNLKQPDENGIIYMARNMSCYLTSKQPYIVIGPKFNLKRYDEGYIRKGFENELSFGFLMGYGINYIFQGKSFAPEICYSMSSTSNNKISDARKMTHTVSVSLNFF